MSVKTRKVVIIGVGNVGVHCGLSLAFMGQADEIVFIDMDKPKAVSQAMDLDDAVSFLPQRVKIKSGEYDECSNADIVVITAGRARRPGETRTDMMSGCIRVMNTIVEPIIASGFNGILINISNPADIITDYIAKKMNFPKNKVICTGTSLDSGRLLRFLSNQTGVDRNSIHAYVMGEHGESEMIPYSNITFGGKKLLDLMKEYPDTYGKLDLPQIANDVKTAGQDIIKGKGCTEFGIGMALCDLVKAIFHDEKRILPVSVYLDGEYGQKGVYAGVPVIIGKDGAEEVIEIEMTTEEKALFDKSCDAMRGYIEIADAQLAAK
ncbi:MAG: L-lactate dehydrogenase [Oscillospiraceae bacterium]